jgi:hypothetical protein
MFKRGLFMAFMALISIACCKDNPSNVTPQDEQMGTLEVSVYDELTTRATSASVNDSNIENVQIAHTVASFWGVYDFGDQSEYSYLGKE